MRRFKSRAAIVGLLAVIVLSIILLPAHWLGPARYSAYSGAIQAFGVLIALVIAVATLQADSTGRRVDRTLALHKELTSGEIGEARRRLGIHLRQHGTLQFPVRRTVMADLRDHPILSKYGAQFLDHSAYQDVNLLVRFFERARLAQVRLTIDEPLFAELIGRHAVWWDHALLPDNTNARYALQELASWANTYAATNQSRYPFLKNWEGTRVHDFPADPIGNRKFQRSEDF